jgi:hypothetical protein
MKMRDKPQECPLGFVFRVHYFQAETPVKGLSFSTPRARRLLYAHSEASDSALPIVPSYSPATIVFSVRFTPH